MQDKLHLTGTSRSLDYNEGIGSFHEPGLNLRNVLLAVVPHCAETSLVRFAVFEFQNVVGSCCLGFKPLVRFVVGYVEGVRNMTFDEERPYPSILLARGIKVLLV